MNENEKSGIWWKVILSLVLVAVLIGGGFALYRIGFNQGAFAAEGGNFATEGWFEGPMMHHGFYPMYGHGYFPIGGLIMGVIFLLVVFAILRHLIFGPRWYRWGYGPGRYYGPHSHHWHEHEHEHENFPEDDEMDAPPEKEKPAKKSK